MDSGDLQVLRAACRWADEGRRFALVTVARTWGSSPRPPGAWLALRDDGVVEGSVSGGCIEDDLMRRMQAHRLAVNHPPGTDPDAADGPPQCTPYVLTYGVTREEAGRFGLPCGGTLQLVVEPQPDVAVLRELAQRIAARQLAARRVDVASGHTTLAPARRGDALQWDGTRLVTLHGPRLRLILIGAGQVSRYLAQMAQALDYAVTVSEPRAEYRSGWDVTGTQLSAEMPDDLVLALAPDPHTAIVALTHDPKLDDMALLEALKSPAFYVAAIGSKVNTAARRQRLSLFDLSDDEVARLRGPAGLPIGSRTPAEIAVSILAEMTAVKNGVATTGAPHIRPAGVDAGCAAS